MVQVFLDQVLRGPAFHPYLDACALALLFCGGQAAVCQVESRDSMGLLQTWSWECGSWSSWEGWKCGGGGAQSQGQGAAWCDGSDCFTFGFINSHAALNSVPAYPGHWNTGRYGRAPGQSKKNFVGVESFFFFNLYTMLIKPTNLWGWPCAQFGDGADTLMLAKWGAILTLTVKAF